MQTPKRKKKKKIVTFALLMTMTVFRNKVSHHSLSTAMNSAHMLQLKGLASVNFSLRLVLSNTNTIRTLILSEKIS